MTEQPLQLLQWVADHTPVDRTMVVAPGHHRADLCLDKKREHVDGEGVSQHVRRDMQVKALGAAACVGPQEGGLPSGWAHRVAAIGQPQLGGLGRRIVRPDYHEARALAGRDDVETAAARPGPAAIDQGIAVLPLQHSDRITDTLPAAPGAPSRGGIGPLDLHVVVDAPQEASGDTNLAALAALADRCRQRDGAGTGVT